MKYPSFGRCCLLCGSNNIIKCNECVCCGVAAKSVYVSIPLSGTHCSLQAFVRHVVEHAGTVVIVESVSLPYETYKSTGKDIVVARTHYIKGFQIMKRNQFCLCRVQGHPETCFCKITVRRSKIYSLRKAINIWITVPFVLNVGRFSSSLTTIFGGCVVHILIPCKVLRLLSKKVSLG